MAYDDHRDRVVLFGGTDSSFLNDTWEFDGVNWQLRLPPSSPPVRHRHAMAFSSASQQTLLFGGISPAGQLGDTWMWDGINWTEAFPSSSPQSRNSAGLAFDEARQVAVLFGGHAGGHHGDTWEWNGTNWIQRSPAQSPSARTVHGMAYDTVRQRVVLFGGYDGSYRNDTWEYDGTNWTERTPVLSPPARTLHSMAYDQHRQRIVVFGGHDGTDLIDTWEWDGTAWLQRAPVNNPPARREHRIVFDSNQDRIVLFGGWNGSASYFADSWQLLIVSPPTTATATVYGSGCGSPALHLDPDGNAAPIIGQTASATVTNAPTALCGVSLGLSNTVAFPVALPFDLVGMGMPGCDLLQSNNVFGLVTSPITPSTLSFSAAIPDQIPLLGSHAYLQAYCFAPGANAAQVIVSNGLDWLIGNQ